MRSSHFCDRERKCGLRNTLALGRVHPQPGPPLTFAPSHHYPQCQRLQPGIRLQAEELEGEERGEELTSETTDGHCARLVVSVHSLKLREEGTE